MLSPPGENCGELWITAAACSATIVVVNGCGFSTAGCVRRHPPSLRPSPPTPPETPVGPGRPARLSLAREPCRCALHGELEPSPAQEVTAAAAASPRAARASAAATVPVPHARVSPSTPRSKVRISHGLSGRSTEAQRSSRWPRPGRAVGSDRSCFPRSSTSTASMSSTRTTRCGTPTVPNASHCSPGDARQRQFPWQVQSGRLISASSAWAARDHPDHAGVGEKAELARRRPAPAPPTSRPLQSAALPHMAPWDPSEFQ